MKSSSGPDYTVTEASADFSASLPSQERERVQGELHKFTRWLGLHRKTNALSPLDIASYSEQLTPPEAKAIKAFLTYVHKREFTAANLANHLRVKKAPRKAAPTQPQENTPIQMTQRGYGKLETELATLRSQRSNVTEEVRRAAADKDFRENAPLEAARERKSHLEGRIQEIESTLKSAVIVKQSQRAAGIKIGDTVTLCDLNSGTQLTYILVDTREANPTEGRISSSSPIGRTLIQKERGQTIEIAAPAGTFRYRIEGVQHETS